MIRFPSGWGWAGWPMFFLLWLGIFLVLTAVRLAIRRAWARRQRRKTPELPPDFLGGMTPAIADRWYDLAARYHEQTAAEPVYPRRAKG